MTAGLDALAGVAGKEAGRPMSAAIARLGPPAGAGAGTTWLGWQDDVDARDQSGGYEVRLSPAALREMHAESARGRGFETGGTLFGETDDA
jgi:hypothetical protein